MKITVETIVKAPVAKVWSAYTTPVDIKQWSAASDDWHTTMSTVDLRVRIYRNKPQNTLFESD